MNFTKPLLSGTAALIVGGIGVALAAASPLLPAPWGAITGIVGFLAAALAGLSAKAPAITEGKPILQGGALMVATGIFGMLEKLYPALPAGWPQSMALAAAAVLAILVGKALPALGTPSPETLAAAAAAGNAASAAVDTKQAALDVLKGAGPKA